jgi:hypothetical protein
MSTSVNQGYDVCGPNVVVRQVQKNSFPENYQNLVGLSHRGPKHPSFITYQSRLETFYANNWPRSMPQKPEALAEAGFYYEGDLKDLKQLKLMRNIINHCFNLKLNLQLGKHYRILTT